MPDSAEAGDSVGAWITTTTLLNGLQEYQNQQAWDQFVQRFRLPIQSFVRRLGVEESACEDVTQETLLAFAEAFRRGRYDRHRGRLSGWLFGIAFRQAQAQRRRVARRQTAAQSQTVSQWPDEPTAGEAWDRIWERFLLERSLKRARLEFSERTFKAFEAVALKDRPVDETAGRLGISPKAVYNAKHRILTRVRELMQDLETVRP